MMRKSKKCMMVYGTAYIMYTNVLHILYHNVMCVFIDTTMYCLIVYYSNARVILKKIYFYIRGEGEGVLRSDMD